MNKVRKSDVEDVSYWLSYSDMMAALLLVFVLIITFTMLQSQIQFELKSEEIDKQQEEIIKQQEEIKKQQETIDKLLGVKSDIIEALVKEFESSGLEIRIDKDTGDIMFDSDLLFDPDSAVLKSNSKVFLDAFLPKYFSIILSDDYLDNVAEIVIEGHTAKYGSYLGCLRLSQQRALAVAEYASSDNSILKSYIDLELLRNVMTVNGRAYYDPIYFEDGSYDSASSRRVEIKFRLKDDDIIQEMHNFFKED